MANQLLIGPGVKKFLPTLPINKGVARAFRIFIIALLALLMVEYLYGPIRRTSPLPQFASQINLKTENDESSKTENKTESTHPVVINRGTTAGKGLLSIISETVKKAVNKIVDSSYLTTKEPAPVCKLPPDLGPIKVNQTPVDLESVEIKYPQIKRGGWYVPRNCTARQTVAIIVPYRNRDEQLPILMNNLHPFLMRQQIEYRIFIISQLGTRGFNRAKLFNVGFVESNKMRPGGWECFIFHDVDLLPMDERNLYSCSDQPRHLSPARDTTKFKLAYKGYFGGVSALTYKQFKDVNGFSNVFWGWGAEDDNMYDRLTKKLHYNITRDDISIGRYTMLKHTPGKRNPGRFKAMDTAIKNYKTDGLSSLKYKLADFEFYPLYSFINVNIDEE